MHIDIRMSTLLNESTLPRDILLNSILPYLDLRTVTLFSTCSKSCQHLIFHEAPPTYWTEIHFLAPARHHRASNTSTSLSPSFCKITDDQLRIFLVKINAKENTKVLSLRGCINITGRGLEPLFGSTVLEDVDLHRHAVHGGKHKKYLATGTTYTSSPSLAHFDENLVISILESMLPSIQMRHLLQSMPSIQQGRNHDNSTSYYRPFSLRRVVFPLAANKIGEGNGDGRGNGRGEGEGERTGRSAVVQRFIQFHEYWKHVQDNFNSDGKSCSKCNKIFCDSIAWRCCACGEFSCDNAVSVTATSNNDHEHENGSMEEGEDNNHCECICYQCSLCNDKYCSVNTNNDTANANHNILFCTVCNKHYCEPCAEPPICSECNIQKCQWCSNLVTCTACQKESCANHGFECCGCCENVFCEDCQEEELGFCVVCNTHYCSGACHEGAHH